MSFSFRVPTPGAVIRLLSLATGCLLLALSFNLFLNPNRIATGGVPGLSTILEHTAGWNPAFSQWGINLALLAAAWLFLGSSFALRTVIGSALLPLFVFLTNDLQAPTGNPLLASIYGGIGTGVGIGLVFRSRSSVGGVTVVAQLLHRYARIGLSSAVTMLDFSVIAISGLVFSAEEALYAMIGLYVMKKTITVVQEGLGQSKIAYIISNHNEAVKTAILRQLDRGLTEIPAIGGYTGSGRPVLMVVLEQEEVPVLKSLVQQQDPDAFLIIGDAREVSGEGFNRFREGRSRRGALMRWRKWTNS